MRTVNEIEDAIVTALSPLSERGVRIVKTYQGELDSEENLARALHRFPAVLVTYGGSEFGSENRRTTETMTFVVFVCDRSLRAEEEARRGGENNPGTYRMLEETRELLHQNNILEGITSPQVKREAPYLSSQNISIYTAEYDIVQHRNS